MLEHTKQPNVKITFVATIEKAQPWLGYKVAALLDNLVRLICKTFLLLLYQHRRGNVKMSKFAAFERLVL